MKWQWLITFSTFSSIIKARKNFVLIDLKKSIKKKPIDSKAFNYNFSASLTLFLCKSYVRFLIKMEVLSDNFFSHFSFFATKREKKAQYSNGHIIYANAKIKCYFRVYNCQHLNVIPFSMHTTELKYIFPSRIKL